MSLLPPTNVVGSYQNKATNQNTLQIKLTWTAPVGSDLFDKYFIYRNDVKLAEVDDAITTYLDETLMGTVNYVSYYVTTWKSGATPAESAISNIVSNYSLAFEDLIARLRESYLMDIPVDPRMKRWTDEQLLEYINVGLDDVNTEPPSSNYNLENLPPGWRSLVLIRAKIEALSSRAGLEVAKEFQFGFGGVSVQIDRSQKYVSVSTAERTAYNERLHKAKLASVMITVSPGGILTSDLPFKIRTYSPRMMRIR